MPNIAIPGVLPAVIAALLFSGAWRCHQLYRRRPTKSKKWGRLICAAGGVIYALLALFGALAGNGVIG
ncbi:MAG: hypothetical protein LBK98_09355 [Peptococcaceae bacterium]|jgi:hypothetical protein|nr:hypothetical protein [Peptococcaceae bacterium]